MEVIGGVLGREVEDIDIYDVLYCLVVQAIIIYG